MKNQKMYAFVYNIETKQVSNLSREAFIGYDKGNELNWNSYKEQLEKGSYNVKTYEGAKYIYVNFFRNNTVFVFGFGLTKELVVDICEIELTPVKCVGISANKKYKFIPYSKVFQVCDKEDIEMIKMDIQSIKPGDAKGYGCLDSKEFIGLYFQMNIDDSFMKTEFDMVRFVNGMLASRKKAEASRKKYGDANAMKVGFLQKFNINLVIGLFTKLLNKTDLPDEARAELREILDSYKSTVNKGVITSNTTNEYLQKIAELKKKYNI